MHTTREIAHQSSTLPALQQAETVFTHTDQADSAEARLVTRYHVSGNRSSKRLSYHAGYRPRERKETEFASVDHSALTKK